MKFHEVKMCSVSTAHISRQDNELLLKVAEAEDFWVLTVYRKSGGFFIFVDDFTDDTRTGPRRAMEEADFSQEFIDLMEAASMQGYWWMLLDEDEQPHPELPVFDW